MKKQPQPPPGEEATAKVPPPDKTIHFPIVGIGASAGGLEALEQFLGHTPPDSGMAFVIIQHLDPTHKGIMPELLRRATTMEVIQVKDRTRVKPNHVYVIPPNADMSVLHGTLHLLPPIAPRGLRLPVDYFFRSLADDEKEKSIAVILSGMGSDGSMGLRAIKEKAGVTFVQDPATSKFNGMPRSAIDAGLADVVAPVEELPAKILAYLQHAHLVRSSGPLEAKSLSAIEKITILLRTATGNDFSLYKKNTIYRRIERRMGIHQIDKIAVYVRYLQENPQELHLLFKELLIGVTSFFRDPGSWEALKTEGIPAILANAYPGQALRAWVVGCSTGEEAYSLAMVFKEAAAKENVSLQIFATDLDQDAIERARQGYYPANIAADVTPERLRRFFVREEPGYRINKEIREMVIFAPQNVTMDPPFTKLDVLTCRNLLIYLMPELQKKLLPLFHYSLRPGGLLFLGNSETIGSLPDLFVPINSTTRIYRRKDTVLSPEQLQFPRTFAAPPGGTDDEAAKRPAPNIEALAGQTILARYAPAAVLAGDKGDILYISGRTGKYLEPAVGKVNWNIFAMAREGLRYELVNAFQKALRQKGAVIVRGLMVRTNGNQQAIDLTVEALEEPQALRGTVIIVFSDVATPPPAGKTRKAPAAHSLTAQMERELQQAREELQTNREEMQTSQEELKSANEELQSTNEELQSTNEELTTSKEEMQSMNEELQTVNAELQAKVDELSRANNDMKNLLNSTSIATVFLDGDLKVRRFTPQVTNIIKLIPHDVGRPLTDIVSSLRYPELVEDARGVLETLVFAEKEVSTTEGRWYLVRIMPYRTLGDVIDGLVMTFVDITTAKKLEEELRRTLEEQRKP